MIKKMFCFCLVFVVFFLIICLFVFKLPVATGDSLPPPSSMADLFITHTFCTNKLLDSKN